MFKNEQLLAADERERHEEGTPPPPKRRKVARIAEESLHHLRDKLDRKQINREKFLKDAGLRYFQYLKIE